MDFLSWNDLIAEYFFRPEMAGRRVYLYVTEGVLNEVGDGGDLDNFIEAVKVGPPNLTRQGLCQRALQTMQNWRFKNFPFPPYMAYLALFVLAAGKEGDFAPNAYYPRLRSLLGEEPRAGHYPSFEHMVSLWDDLELWSNKDRAGELGIFYNNSIAGSWFHVGIPIAQTFLTEHERAVLPDIFARTAMDPNAPPSDEELAALIRRFGQGEVRPRTLALLARKNVSEEDLRSVLIETIGEELSNWDGTTPESETSSQHGPLNGTLRLCCQLDEVAGVVDFTFRVSSKHDFPVDGLSLALESRQNQFSAEEYGLGWSTPLVEPSGKPLDAAQFNWSDDLLMKDKERNWLVRLPGAAVRVFVGGEPYSFHGLVEVRRLPQSARFYLATRRESYRAISEWGGAQCERFREISVRGLPEGWLFTVADRACDDAGIRQQYPMLSLPVATRLSFRGGVRVSRGNEFFRFAPPRIVLDGRDDATEVYCNNVRLECNATENFFALPENLPAGTQLTVEARRDGSAVRKLSFYLEEEFPAFDYEQGRQFDAFGDEILETTNSDWIAGALVQGTALLPFNFGNTLRTRGAAPTFYLGRSPGQVIAHPVEPLPESWSPVWQITIRRTGIVEYCGTSLSNSEPNSMPEPGDHKKLQLWKDLIWHRRKRITPPATSAVRKLWRQYLDVARNV